MSTTLIVVLSVGFLFGAMVLMLAMGYQETEQKRALAAKADEIRPAQEAAATISLPGFFGSPRAVQPSTLVVFDDDMVSRLETHVRLEQAVVAQFVNHPSIDNLYRNPPTPAHVH